MILQRYIFAQLLLTFLFLFVVCLAVCLVGMLFNVFRSFGGVDAEFLGRMSILAAGYVAPLVLLFSCCPATSLVYGRLAADNEIDAMRMSGLHANRFIAPALLFGILLTLASYGFLEYLTPTARDQRRKALKDSALSLLKLPPPGKQVGIGLGPYMLSYMDYKNGRMERIDLMRAGRDGPLEEYQAVSGYALLEPGKPPQIILSKPSIIRYTEGKEIRLTWENDFPITLDVGDFGGSRKMFKDMTLEELEETYARTTDYKDRATLRTLYHVRYGQSIAPMFLVLASVAVGIFVRPSSRLAGLGSALPIFLLYMVVFFTGKAMGESADLNPILAAYLPIAVLAGVTAVLLFLVYRR